MQRSAPPKWRWISRRPRASSGVSRPRPRCSPGPDWSRRAPEQSARPPPPRRPAQTDTPPALQAVETEFLQCSFYHFIITFNFIKFHFKLHFTSLFIQSHYGDTPPEMLTFYGGLRHFKVEVRFNIF